MTGLAGGDETCCRQDGAGGGSGVRTPLCVQSPQQHAPMPATAPSQSAAAVARVCAAWTHPYETSILPQLHMTWLVWLVWASTLKTLPLHPSGQLTASRARAASPAPEGLAHAAGGGRRRPFSCQHKAP